MVKFIDSNDRAFFECHPSEARVAIEVIQRYRERKDSDTSISIDLRGLMAAQEQVGFAMADDYGVTIAETVDGAPSYVEALMREWGENELFRIGTNDIEKSQVGIILADKVKRGVLYRCSVSDLKDHFVRRKFTPYEIKTVMEKSNEMLRA